MVLAIAADDDGNNLRSVIFFKGVIPDQQCASPDILDALSAVVAFELWISQALVSAENEWHRVLVELIFLHDVNEL
jgi:hypothetical protein